VFFTSEDEPGSLEERTKKAECRADGELGRMARSGIQICTSAILNGVGNAEGKPKDAGREVNADGRLVLGEMKIELKMKLRQ